MASRETLTAQARDASGKSPVARRLRKQGIVPGVLYKSGESLAFSANERELTALLRHGATLIEVDVDGAKHTSVIKDYQVHPVRGTLMHVDLQEVRMDERIRSTVQLVIVGDSPGVKAGGLLSQMLHEVAVESTPGNIPDSLEIDVSTLDLGETMPLSAASLPEGVALLDDGDQTVVTVAITRGARAEAAGEAYGDEVEPVEGEDGAAEGDAAAGDAGSDA